MEILRLDFLDYYISLVLLLALAGLFLAFLAPPTARAGPAVSGVLVVLAALAAWCFTNFGSFHEPHAGFVHNEEMFHYYLSSRYVSEVGYYDLYGAAVAAGSELPGSGLSRVRRVRNLRTYDLMEARELRSDHRYRDAFSDSRWDQFKQDIRYFVREIPLRDDWARLLLDHGYNAPPSRTALTAPLVSALGRASDRSLMAAALIDPLLLCVLIVVTARVYGTRIAAFLLIVLGTSTLSSFLWIGGSFARFDWFVLSGLGVISLATKRHRLAGVLFGASMMLRVFPVLFLLPVVLRGGMLWWRTGRWEARYQAFLSGIAISGAVLGLASLFAGGGLEAWLEFVSKIQFHAEGVYDNHVGLRGLLGHGPAGLWLVQIAAAGLVVAALPRVDDAQAALLGGFWIYAFTFPASYYYCFLALYWLWQRDPVITKKALLFHGLVLGTSLVVVILESRGLPMRDQFFGASVSLALAFAALFWWVFASPASLRSEAPEEEVAVS